LAEKISKNAIGQLYEKYRDSLMVIACSYTHNRQDAEDLVQAAFLKASLSYEPRGSFLYWCNKVMRNEFYNSVKKAEMMADEPIDTMALRSQDDLLLTYIHNEERAKLATMISMLPLKYREVMMDSVYLQLTDSEIAKERGTTDTNVRQIRSRAKKMLIKMREDEDEGYR